MICLKNSNSCIHKNNNIKCIYKYILLFVMEEVTNKSNKKQNIKNIITASKYLKKVIARLPKETLTYEEKQRLFVQYEELVEVIVTDCKSMSIEFS